MTDFSEATSDRILIEGVSKLGWGKGQDCTFAGALAAAMPSPSTPTSIPN
jgi:hypothetical protein